MTILFEQQRNSHDEYLMNENLLNKRVISNGKTFPIQGHGMIIVHHLWQSSQDPKNLSKGQLAWGKSPSRTLGALGDQTKILW